VFINGDPQFIDESLQESLPLPNAVRINGVVKKTRINVKALMGRIERRVPAAILQSNALWKMMDS
jgi:hypothetical protein